MYIFLFCLLGYLFISLFFFLAFVFFSFWLLKYWFISFNPFSNSSNGDPIFQFISLCVCHAVAESLRRWLYQAPISMNFLASSIFSSFGGCMCISWIPRWEWIHMDRPMAPAAYVAEDGLVGHKWEEKPRLDPPPPSVAECQGGEVGKGCGWGGGTLL